MLQVTLVDIISTINKSYIVKSTKLDSTIKAIINNFKKLNIESSSTIINYLNIIRVIYYLKRLKYYNNTKYLNTISKFNNFPI
jgi:hypothetical protein